MKIYQTLNIPFRQKDITVMCDLCYNIMLILHSLGHFTPLLISCHLLSDIYVKKTNENTFKLLIDFTKGKNSIIFFTVFFFS